MKAKIISIIVCMLFIVTIIPETNSLNNSVISSAMSGDRNQSCDLTITSVFYTPNPPVYGCDLFFNITIVDQLGHITNGDVNLQTISEEYGVNFPQTIEMHNGIAYLRFFFTWCMSGTYSLRFVVSPNDPLLFNETDWSDNTYIVENISAMFTPVFLLGSIYNVTIFGDGWYVKTNHVFYIQIPFKIGIFPSNDTIAIPIKYLNFGYIGPSYFGSKIIIGFFKMPLL